MKTKYSVIISLLLSCLITGGGCSGEEVVNPENPGNPEIPENPEVPEPGLIQLSSGITGLAGGVLNAAASQFPNDRTIGIIAAEYKLNEYGDPDINWTTYGDIQNEAGTAGVPVSGIFGFDWVSPKYWPVDNTELIFAAYAPHTGNYSEYMELNNDHTAINLTFRSGMPDILYASDNGVAGSYRRMGNTTVDLGEFEHALCQMEIWVKADEGMNPDVRLNGVRVLTTIEKATLSLVPGQSDEEENNRITLGTANNEVELILLSDGRVNFKDNSYSSGEVLVLPYSQDNADLLITLYDGGFDISHKINMSMFDVEFKPGKKVTLTVIVKSLAIVGPDSEKEIELVGILGPWKNKGSSSITIQ